MSKRTSVVKHLKTNSVINSSIQNIGDTHQANPVTRVIALQKEGPTFQGDLQFEDYSIFQREANWPDSQPNVIKRTVHHNPYIHVNNASIIAASASSIIHVGNLNYLSAESRIKHFRILLAQFHPD
ncbi:spore germination protein GerPE [Oceanobacillus salinisoli]|uniref:spore germination protein GerPE n=1 Tax=Oceanobacillus salinisoli TaxID=2678611 RepID=UPI0018CC5800|nr:spore germination protein GerPE [Oceanobacillus salinisoli]